MRGEFFDIFVKTATHCAARGSGFNRGNFGWPQHLGKCIFHKDLLTLLIFSDNVLYYEHKDSVKKLNKETKLLLRKREDPLGWAVCMEEVYSMGDMGGAIILIGIVIVVAVFAVLNSKMNKK